MRVERWGWYSVAVNVVLAGINLLVALASGSLAVRAETIHNLVDLPTAFAVPPVSNWPPTSRAASPTVCTSWRTSSPSSWP